MTKLEFSKMYGRRVRVQRQRRKWSETMLADYLGVHRNTINRWELGLCCPSLYEAVMLKEVLGDSALVEAIRNEA